MAFEQIEPFASAVRIYEGSPKCKKTVIISVIDRPAGEANVWISQDQDTLDKGKDTTAFQVGHVPFLSAGVPLLEPYATGTGTDPETRTIIPDVSGDIWARATNYDETVLSPSKPKRKNPIGTITILVESF